MEPNTSEGKLTDEVKDFLRHDYDLKIGYLTNHFQRMWMRFNFFIAIQSAILGSKFLIGDGKISPQLAALGAGISLIWYIMGAEDRFLSRVYRKQVADAAEKVVSFIWNDKERQKSYHFVGEIDETARGLRGSISGWRIEQISTTRLAALVPLLCFIVWSMILILLLK